MWGRAARNAILAALLGARGFTANPAAIEGRGGFASTFARGLEWQPDAFDDLGRSFDLAERGFRPKRYPCGGVIHTGIDAALKLRDELGPRVADISAIKAGISKYAANRASEQYPTNTEAAKFNLQYVVAYALANGPPMLSAFGEDAINDARVKALARMVSVAIDPEFADAHEDYPTRLTVTLGDGRTLEQLRVYASGTGNIRCRRRRSRTSSWIARRRRSRPTRRSRSLRRCARLASRKASPNSGRCCAGAERREQGAQKQTPAPRCRRGRRLFDQPAKGRRQS